MLKEKRILRLEELAINAFPAILTEVYDGWILRFSDGYTNRGNCVNPLYSSFVDLEQKVIFCEQKYRNRELLCIFKMTEAAPYGLEQVLEEKGYKIETPSHIMELPCDETKLHRNLDIQVNIQHNLSEKWMDGMFALTEKNNDTTRALARTMLGNIKNQVICASIYDKKKMIACGLGVMEDGEVGLYSIAVSEEYRRYGYGSLICEEIMAEGKKANAESVYLQVAAENKAALRLYEKLGFKKSYTYWYRVKYQ